MAPIIGMIYRCFWMTGVQSRGPVRASTRSKAAKDLRLETLLLSVAAASIQKSRRNTPGCLGRTIGGQTG
eukprot:s2083_g18.t1